MRVIVAAGDVFEVALGNQRTDDGGTAAVNFKFPVIAEILMRHIQGNGVRFQGQYRTGGKNRVKKSLFFEIIVLLHPGFIDEVHRLFHLVFHELIVRGQ